MTLRPNCSEWGPWLSVRSKDTPGYTGRDDFEREGSTPPSHPLCPGPIKAVFIRYHEHQGSGAASMPVMPSKCGIPYKNWPVPHMYAALFSRQRKTWAGCSVFSCLPTVMGCSFLLKHGGSLGSAFESHINEVNIGATTNYERKIHRMYLY